MESKTKKWALAMAACLSTALAACGSDGDSQENLDPGQTGIAPVTLFDPVAASAVVPFPIDLFFVDSSSQSGFSTDTTLNIPNSGNVPFVTQANLQDGFSTVAEAFMDILGLNIDLDTANAGGVPAARGVIVVNTSSGALLNPGLDYQVTRSAVIPTRTRLYIQWLRPLAPRSTYAVVVTDNLSTTDGVPVDASVIFQAVRSADALGSEGNPVPPVTPALTQEQIARLEQIRQFMQPLFQFAGAAPPAGLGVGRENIILAWPFTTQSTGDSLAALNAAATPKALGVSPAPGPGGTLSTGELGIPGLPDTADIYAGTLQLPYYLQVAAAANDPTPLISFWQSNGVATSGNSHLPNTPPCGAFQASVSTTACFPMPAMQSTVTVPVVALVPNGNSSCPALPPPGGFPVTIFIHGITRSRADALIVGPALANACQVTIAIDLPLHGVTPQSPFASLRIPGVSERTFDVDYAPTQIDGAGNCSQSTANPAALNPDGVEDCSGGHFINLGSLITSRDNLRQGVIDNIHLLKSVQAMDLVVVDGTGTPVGSIDTNTAVTNLLGHSLGGIVATTLMAINDEGTAASVAMAGGGIAKLLDGSPTFGPAIAAGLQANGIVEGTDNYETFLRFAQTLVDSADPVNHGEAAADNYPIHFMEVVGEEGQSLPDQVVPNNVPASSTGSIVITAGPLGGTDPLVEEMGLVPVEAVNPEAASPACTAGPDTVVKFTRGGHGSILDPSASGATTVEMQTQVASFLGSGGVLLPINGGGGGAACP